MLSVGGMMVSASDDLLTMFVALEVLSLPLYLMWAGPESPPAVAEAAMKYFLLGAFSRRRSSSASRCYTARPAR